jgi:hypothetical protein
MFQSGQISSYQYHECRKLTPVPIPVMNRATIICGTEYAEACNEAPTYFISPSFIFLPRMRAYNNPTHSDPHRQLPPRLLTQQKREYTPRETPEIINRHDNPLECRRRMIKRIEEIRIPDDPAEDALVVAEQDEGHLARNGDCGA